MMPLAEHSLWTRRTDQPLGQWIPLSTQDHQKKSLISPMASLRIPVGILKYRGTRFRSSHDLAQLPTLNVAIKSGAFLTVRIQALHHIDDSRLP